MNKIPFSITPYQWGHEHFILRTAAHEDAHALAEIKTQVWPDEESSPEQIQAALNSPDHLSLVAEHSGSPIAFLDSFWTAPRSGPCWEADLLAVSPLYRGRRLGEALVRASVQTAGNGLSRALIQTGNIASQTTFSRCGFSCAEQIHHLYVSSENYAGAPVPAPQACLLKVVTMNYTGVWLEDSFTAQDLLAARAQIGKGDIALAGAVIPFVQPEACRPAEECGYQYVSSYQWWTKRQ